MIPDANYNGSLAVDVSVSDGSAISNSFTVDITVNAINDAPSVGNDSFTVSQDSTTTQFDVLANDSDVEGDSLTLTSVNYTGNSTVTIDATNNVINYTPASGFSGEETLTYNVSDGNGGSSTGTVTVTVNSTSGGGGGGSMDMWALLLALLCLQRKRLA